MAENDPVMLLLGRIDGKLDGLHEAMVRHFADDARAFRKLDQRLRGLEQNALTPEDRSSLRSLERGHWRTAGIAAGIGLVLGLVGKYVMAALSS